MANVSDDSKYKGNRDENKQQTSLSLHMLPLQSSL